METKECVAIEEQEKEEERDRLAWMSLLWIRLQTAFRLGIYQLL